MAQVLRFALLNVQLERHSGLRECGAKAPGRLRPQIDFINSQDGLQSRPDCFHVNMKESKKPLYISFSILYISVYLYTGVN